MILDRRALIAGLGAVAMTTATAAAIPVEAPPSEALKLKWLLEPALGGVRAENSAKYHLHLESFVVGDSLLFFGRNERNGVELGFLFNKNEIADELWRERFRPNMLALVRALAQSEMVLS